MYQAFVDETANNHDEGRNIWGLNATLYGPQEAIAELIAELPQPLREHKFAACKTAFEKEFGRETLAACFNAIVSGKLKLIITFAEATSEREGFSLHPSELGKVVTLDQIRTDLGQTDKSASQIAYYMDGAHKHPNLTYPSYLSRTNDLNGFSEGQLCVSLANMGDEKAKMAIATDLIAGVMAFYLNDGYADIRRPRAKRRESTRPGWEKRCFMTEDLAGFLSQIFETNFGPKSHRRFREATEVGQYDWQNASSWSDIPPIRLIRLEPDVFPEQSDIPASQDQALVAA